MNNKILMNAYTHKSWPLQPTEAILLALLRDGLFPSKDAAKGAISGNFEWHEVFREAELHTVLPLALEAALSLSPSLRPPTDTVQKFRAKAIQVAAQNERLMAIQVKILQKLARDGINCVVLKGSSAAAAYPRPVLRTLGDIDILVDKGDLERASHVLEELGCWRMKSSEKYDLRFAGQSVPVELHFAPCTYPENQVGETLRDVMVDAISSARTANTESYAFPVLSPQHQAVSLLIHMQLHMKAGGIGLRHVCDFAMFVYRLRPEEWELDIAPIMQQGGLLRFAEVLTKTCVLWLGLPASSASWCNNVEEAVCHELLLDFLNSGNFGRKHPARRASAILSADRAGMGKSRSIPITIVRNLNLYAREHYSIARQMPLLLPFFWVMLPLQYLRNVIKNKGDLAFLETLSSGRRRRRLFAELMIFEVDQTRRTVSK